LRAQIIVITNDTSKLEPRAVIGIISDNSAARPFPGRN
jgi:hypothetical protein